MAPYCTVATYEKSSVLGYAFRRLRRHLGGKRANFSRFSLVSYSVLIDIATCYSLEALMERRRSARFIEIEVNCKEATFSPLVFLVPLAPLLRFG